MGNSPGDEANSAMTLLRSRTTRARIVFDCQTANDPASNVTLWQLSYSSGAYAQAVWPAITRRVCFRCGRVVVVCRGSDLRLRVPRLDSRRVSLCKIRFGSSAAPKCG